MLHMIGIGLGDEKDITLNALEAIKKCSHVYLESYTSKLECKTDRLEELYGKKIIIAERTTVENNAENTILKHAKESDTAFLVIGDIFGATTHVDLALRAKKEKIEVKYYHNASILNAIGVTGLELYKFGKTTSMVFFSDNWKPSTPYEVLKTNLQTGLHTLMLLDIKIAESKKEDILKDKKKPQPPRFMTVNQCLSQLLELEGKYKQKIISENTRVIGCARIGTNSQLIKYGKIKDLLSFDFGPELHCVVIPGKLHFMEEEFLETFSSE